MGIKNYWWKKPSSLTIYIPLPTRAITCSFPHGLFRRSYRLLETTVFLQQGGFSRTSFYTRRIYLLPQATNDLFILVVSQVHWTLEHYSHFGYANSLCVIFTLSNAWLPSENHRMYLLLNGARPRQILTGRSKISPQIFFAEKTSINPIKKVRFPSFCSTAIFWFRLA